MPRAEEHHDAAGAERARCGDEARLGDEDVGQPVAVEVAAARGRPARARAGGTRDLHGPVAVRVDVDDAAVPPAAHDPGPAGRVRAAAGPQDEVAQAVAVDVAGGGARAEARAAVAHDPDAVGAEVIEAQHAAAEEVTPAEHDVGVPRRAAAAGGRAVALRGADQHVAEPVAVDVAGGRDPGAGVLAPEHAVEAQASAPVERRGLGREGEQRGGDRQAGDRPGEPAAGQRCCASSRRSSVASSRS